MGFGLLLRVWGSKTIILLISGGFSIFFGQHKSVGRSITLRVSPYNRDQLIR